MLGSAPLSCSFQCTWSVTERTTEMLCVCSSNAVCLFPIPSLAWPCATCCQMSDWPERMKTRAGTTRRMPVCVSPRKGMWLAYKQVRAVLEFCLFKRSRWVHACNMLIQKCTPAHCSQMNIQLVNPQKYRACSQLPNTKETKVYSYNC